MPTRTIDSVPELLSQLRAAKTLPEQRRLRRQLRSEGHRGGLRTSQRANERSRLSPEHLAEWAHGILNSGPPDSLSCAEWSEHFLRSLGDKAAEQGCDAWGCHLRSHKPEYLIDQVWSHAQRSERYWHTYDGLVLAAEVEWGGSESKVWDDFIKLMDVRADARLFVGNLWGHPWAARRALVSAFDAYVKRHRHGHEKDWVVVMLGPKDEKADYETHLVSRSSKGPQRWSLDTRSWH